MNYKEVFETRYNRESWERVLHDIFQSKAVFKATPSAVYVSGSMANHAFLLGTIGISESERIAVYEVELSENVDILRNRRGIRDMLTTDWRGNGFVGAFVLSHRNNENILRFSYVSETWGFNENDEYVKTSTDTKRFTYLLGEGYSCRTAVQQFEKLRDSRQTLNDITDAFSVEALSKEFFGKYKQHYDAFVEYLSNPANGMREAFIDKNFDRSAYADSIKDREEKPIRDYVKKLLGRIVFLHFLQKKGWLGVPADGNWGDGDRDFMLHLFEYATPGQKANFLDEILEPLFNDAFDTNRYDKKDLYDTKVEGLRRVRIPYLNGGLFERDKLDDNPSRFPAKYFNDLLTTFSQYNFTIDENDPNDAEVGVDPEMLGRIFENLLEDNKDKGAFYTPKEIVKYMCQESLIAYLQTDYVKDEVKGKIRKFVFSHNADDLGTMRWAIDDKLKEVKICDPAIGSGAFPMGLLKELFYCRCAIEPDAIENAAEIKREIIENNIYGVDIEKGAVDIARLRFWLSLIVEEKSPITLPNLDFKIMQGNSLLERYQGYDLSTLTAAPRKTEFDDYYGRQTSFYDDEIDMLREDLLGKLKEYYHCDNHYKRVGLRREIADLVQKQIDAKNVDRSIKNIDISANNKFFLWHTWFNDVFSRPKREGFDIVIGNPPYIQLEKNNGILARLYDNCGYKTFTRTGDIYCLFYERGQQLLRKGGHLCFITSNKWMRAGYGEKLRGFFAGETNPKLLIDFAGIKIFESATVDTNILLFTKEKNGHKTLCAVGDKQAKGSINNLSVFVEQNGTVCEFKNSDSWVILSPIEQSIKKKIESVGTPLKDWDIEIYRGVLTGCNEAFIISTEKRREILANCRSEAERSRTEELIRPILRGRDIKRYGYDWAGLWLINTHNGLKGKLPRIKIEDYPAVKYWLDNGGIAYNGKLYKGYEQIKDRTDQGDTPYNLRNCAYLDLFFQPKICWKAVGRNLTFAIVESGTFLTAPASFISAGSKNELILAFLCSKVGQYFIYKNSDTTGAGDIMLNIQSLIRFPIPLSPPTKITELCSKMIESPSFEIQKELDALVYQTYGLKEDEIIEIEKY